MAKGKDIEKKKLGKLRDAKRPLEQVRMYSEARDFLALYKGHPSFDANRSVKDAKWGAAITLVNGDPKRKPVLI
jgi:hypothetical protein